MLKELSVWNFSLPLLKASRRESSRKEVAVGVEIGDVVEPEADARRDIAFEPHVRRQLERPEGAREADLFRVVDVCVPYHDHGIGRHRRIECVDELA